MRPAQAHRRRMLARELEERRAVREIFERLEHGDSPEEAPVFKGTRGYTGRKSVLALGARSVARNCCFLEPRDKREIELCAAMETA
jgi:hypothetical protein